jgi:hypothetical protein
LCGWGGLGEGGESGEGEEEGADGWFHGR